MKKVLLTLMATLAVCYSSAQLHWEVPYFSQSNQLVAFVQIDGEYCTSNNLEVGAFDINGRCRGAALLADNQRYEYPILEMPIYYDNSGESITFKLWNHEDNAEVEADFSSNFEIFTGETHVELYRDVTSAVILSFTRPILILQNDSEVNSQYIAEGKYSEVTLEGRKLYKNGNWNTLCLPFNVTIENSPLAGADARTLTEASITEGEGGLTLNLDFYENEDDPITTLNAGVPYIIRWLETEGTIENPTFSNVTISQVKPINYDNEAQGAKRVRFIGTYDAMTIGGEDKSILFLGVNDDNESVLYYPNGDEDTLIGAFRAYFKIGDNDQVRDLTAFNLDFGGDKTGILNIEGSKQSAQHGAWHSLEGVKQQGKPARKGLYIHEGRKVVISR